MPTDASGLWWTLVLVDSAVGAGMLLYGIRQKEPLPLVCGIALSVLPMVPGTGMMLVAYNLVVAMVYIVAKRFL